MLPLGLLALALPAVVVDAWWPWWSLGLVVVVVEVPLVERKLVVGGRQNSSNRSACRGDRKWICVNDESRVIVVVCEGRGGDGMGFACKVVLVWGVLVGVVVECWCGLI